MRCLSTLNSGLDARQQPHIGSNPPFESDPLSPYKQATYTTAKNGATPPPPEKEAPISMGTKKPRPQEHGSCGRGRGGAVGGKDINRLTHLLSHRELTEKFFNSLLSLLEHFLRLIRNYISVIDSLYGLKHLLLQVKSLIYSINRP